MPDQLKERVLKLLEDNNFPAAKELYDRWHLEHQQPKPYQQTQPSHFNG